MRRSKPVQTLKKRHADNLRCKNIEFSGCYCLDFAAKGLGNLDISVASANAKIALAATTETSSFSKEEIPFC